MHIVCIVATITDVLENDIDLKMLRSHVTEEFLGVFAEGLKHYLKGDWLLARERLETADGIMRHTTTLANSSIAAVEVIVVIVM